MQCYTILYANDGRFLIFEKREEAYFFHPTTVNRNGIPIANGPGLFAFPGGALNPGGVPFAGCLRELTEECGALINFIYNPAPVALANLDSMTLSGVDNYPIIQNRLNTVGANYHCLYLQFGADDLRQIQAIILNTFLQEANQVRYEIQQNIITQYPAIHASYPMCPLDDELGEVQLWDVQREINEIRLLNQNIQTNWYYQMIVFLANTILNRGIQY